MKLKLLFFKFIFIFSILFSLNILSSTPPLNDLPFEIQNIAKDNMNPLGEAIASAVFDALEDISLGSIDVGDHLNIGLNVSRKVYNNYDVAGTWTLVDKISIPVSIPLVDVSQELFNSGALAGITFGFNNSIDVTNIQVVKSNNYNDVPTPEKIKEDIENFNFTSNNDRENPKIIKEILDSSINKIDPLGEIRYYDILNLINSPLKLPFKVENLNKLKIGEIINYTLNGSVELGFSVGWLVDAGVMKDILDVGASITTYLNGRFKVTVLKLSETKVKVKLTKIRENGVTLTIGGSNNDTSLFSGVIILKQIANHLLSITPFKVSLNQNYDKAFNVIYEYDLVTDEAKLAFEKAMLGRFSYSDELTIIDKDLKDPPVKKLYIKTSTGNSDSKEKKVKLGFLFNHNDVTKVSITDTEFTFPNGDHPVHVYKSESTNSSKLKIFGGSYEKMKYSFTSYFNQENLSVEPTMKDLNLVVEGTIEDSLTSGIEINKYISEVEISVGKKDIIPHPPVFYADNPKEKPTHISRYGRSNFLFRLYLSSDHIEKLINTKEEDYWYHLEKAFAEEEGSWSTPAKRLKYLIFNSPQTLINIPLYIAHLNLREGSNLRHAYGLHKKWLKLKNTLKEPKELVRELGDMFSDSLYAFELVRLIRSVIEGEKVPYMFSAQNRAFGGVIWEQGEGIPQANLLDEKYEREFEFDNPDVVITSDPSAIVENLNVVKVSEEKYKMTFNLRGDPAFLFFKINQKSLFSDNFSLFEQIVKNNNEFHSGINVVEISVNDEISYKKAMFDIINNNLVVIFVGCSLDGRYWGPLDSFSF